MTTKNSLKILELWRIISIFAADMKKSIRIAGVGLVMAVVCGGVYLNGLMPIITGYAAKNLASAVFVS